MWDGTSLHLGHLAEPSIIESSERIDRDGQIGEVDLVLRMELTLLDKTHLLLCLFQLVVVKVLPRFGRLVFDTLLKELNVAEALDLAFTLFFAHC